MPTDPRKRQKQQERRAAKRKAKQHQLVKEKHTGVGTQLADAAKYPIVDCWVTTDLWTQGLGWVCLCRQLPNGRVGFAVFLVDRYCLGVKNAMAEVANRATYEERIVRKMRSQFTAEPMEPAAARKLVEEAVEYARQLGLPPHADYAKAQHIFGDLDVSACTDVFEFGESGKPYFVAGPHDTPERCRRILAALLRSCGPDGFHYLLPLADPSKVLPEALRDREPRVIGEHEHGIITEHRLDDFDETGQLREQ